MRNLEVPVSTYYVVFPGDGGGGGGESESGFQVTGMIEWVQKSKPPPKIPRASNKTSKNLWTKN